MLADVVVVVVVVVLVLVELQSLHLLVRVFSSTDTLPSVAIRLSFLFSPSLSRQSPL